MPATPDQDSALTIGQKEAVEILFGKVRGGHMPDSKEVRERIFGAAARAREMYGGADGERFDEPEERAFYHGLLTGYSVALCLLEQQERARA